MRRVAACLSVIFCCLWQSCLAQAAERTIWLVNIGWHVGIALPIDPAVRRAIPELAAFPEADFVEIGWGDREFYRAENPGPAAAMKAALLPTPAVLHLYAFAGAVGARFSTSEIIGIALPDSEFTGLLQHISASFDRSAAGDGGELGTGLYGASSRFIHATGTFHLARTCNTWTAEALAAAGLDIEPGAIVTAGSLMAAAREALARRRIPR
jgi:uncharacterized protein (TIGR02117 family)